MSALDGCPWVAQRMQVRKTMGKRITVNIAVEIMAYLPGHSVRRAGRDGEEFGGADVTEVTAGYEADSADWWRKYRRAAAWKSAQLIRTRKTVWRMSSRSGP